jgi:sugar phosphate isomerase/epimerase
MEGTHMGKMAVGAFMGLGGNPKESLKRVADLGMTNIQTSTPPDDLFEEPKRSAFIQAAHESSVKITVMFATFPGEDYSDIASVRRTVGYLNPVTREERVQKTLQISDLARDLGVDKVAAHVGFVPEETNDPEYAAMVEVVRRLCDHCKGNGQYFCMETGQETAEVLLRFIHDINRDNLRVNFDPANMILYGSGEPIAALKLVAKYVASVHCKDGKWPTEAGKLGHEYPLGQGDVGIDRFVATLKEIGYDGPLTIEREISGDQQIKDILEAKKLLEQLREAS